MSIDEKDVDYYQLFDVQPESAGGDPGAETDTDGLAEDTKTEPETLEPGPEEGPEPEGAGGDDLTEPDGEETEPDEDEPEGDGDSAVEERPQQKRKQSKKENARYAAERRKREQAEAIERARQEERDKAHAEFEAKLASAQFENPYTGDKITTEAEFDAWQERHREEQRRQFQRRSGLSDEQMEEFVSHLPEVQEARAAREQADRVLQDAAREHAAAAIENELAVIRQYDPNVKTLSDIEGTKEHDEILAKVQRGYTLSDAWRLTHQNALIQMQADAARQAAVSNARGKGHLAATRSRGHGMEPVPSDVREMYRAINPDATDEEILRDYNRYLNK